MDTGHGQALTGGPDLARAASSIHQDGGGYDVEVEHGDGSSLVATRPRGTSGPAVEHLFCSNEGDGIERLF
jgi:hypothetical protein